MNNEYTWVLPDTDPGTPIQFATSHAAHDRGEWADGIVVGPGESSSEIAVKDNSGCQWTVHWAWTRMPAKKGA